MLPYFDGLLTFHYKRQHERNEVPPKVGVELNAQIHFIFA